MASGAASIVNLRQAGWGRRDMARYNDLINQLDAATTPQDQQQIRDQLNQLPPALLKATFEMDQARARKRET